MAEEKPVIIIKKGGGHHAHHGGAWKVAYADFVTAMMAFFMVMWLVNSAATPVKQSLANYFRKPGIFSEGSGTPLEIGGGGILPDAPPPRPEEKKKGSGVSSIQLKKKSGTDEDILTKRANNKITGGDKAVGDLPEVGNAPYQGAIINQNTAGDIESKFAIPESEEDIIDTILLEGQSKNQESQETEQSISPIEGNNEKDQLKSEIESKVLSDPKLEEILGAVDVKFDAEGLNIEIMDSEKSSMFRSASASIQPEAEEAFRKIAHILSPTKSSIEIVGHTDAKPFANRLGGYSNWELSADRANAARRLLQRSGISGERITSVVGRADKEPRITSDPFAASNRRITLKIKFREPIYPLAVGEAATAEQMKDQERRDTVHSFTSQELLAGGNKQNIRQDGIGESTSSPTGNRTAVKEKQSATKKKKRKNALDPLYDDTIFNNSPIIVR